MHGHTLVHLCPCIEILSELLQLQRRKTASTRAQRWAGVQLSEVRQTGVALR